jgi:hypothetical protein
LVRVVLVVLAEYQTRRVSDRGNAVETAHLGLDLLSQDEGKTGGKRNQR